MLPERIVITFGAMLAWVGFILVIFRVIPIHGCILNITGVCIQMMIVLDNSK